MSCDFAATLRGDAVRPAPQFQMGDQVRLHMEGSEADGKIGRVLDSGYDVGRQQWVYLCQVDEIGFWVSPIECEMEPVAAPQPDAVVGVVAGVTDSTPLPPVSASG